MSANPQLTGWTMLGKHGLAWYRDCFRIQSSGGGFWGLHVFPYPQAIHDYRQNGRYLGNFAGLDAVEDFIRTRTTTWQGRHQ